MAIERVYPRRIICDNGPGFRSRAFDAWAYEHRVVVAFIQPGKRPVRRLRHHRAKLSLASR